MAEFIGLLGILLVAFIALAAIYIQVVGIIESFKAHIGLGIVSIFVGPFALVVGAMKVFTGENILLRKQSKRPKRKATY